MDQPEQSEKRTPAAAALVHRVGIERFVDSQPGVESRDRVTILVELRQAAYRRADGRRSRSSA